MDKPVVDKMATTAKPITREQSDEARDGVMTNDIPADGYDAQRERQDIIRAYEDQQHKLHRTVMSKAVAEKLMDEMYEKQPNSGYFTLSQIEVIVDSLTEE